MVITSSLVDTIILAVILVLSLRLAYILQSIPNLNKPSDTLAANTTLQSIPPTQFIPALSASPQSPPKTYPRAYASLAIGDGIVDGICVLFYALQKQKAIADFAVMTHNINSSNLAKLHKLGIRTFPITPLEFESNIQEKGEKMEKRDGILWSKLRVWQLEEYSKVIMLDADLLVTQNVDELFAMPEVSGSAMVDHSEKIMYFKSAEYSLRPRNKVDRTRLTYGVALGWSGLNSGVTVLVPSNQTFNNMLTELSIIPNRPCCPSQEFIYNFFEERKSYYRIPIVYNSRVVSDQGVGKIHHFVGAKPWKKRDKSRLNEMWWKLYDEVQTRI